MIFLTALLCSSCAIRPRGGFDASTTPGIPDYALTSSWAALPFTVDSADVVPDPALLDRQDSAAADVFYVYPTTYTGKRGHKFWNADINDRALNVRTDKTAIRNQATVFNGSCKVYAPRYRQAHLECFYTRKQKEDATAALGLAYTDVRTAFQYYLEHYNRGRPLIIASHSQGTVHASRLIQEFYSGESAVPDLIAAYLIGMPVEKARFEELPPCESPEDVHCFCSWRTVDEKYKPSRYYPVGEKYAVTNPVSWTDTVGVASRADHSGAVLTKFYGGLYSEFLDVRVDKGLLRVSRPKIPGMLILPMRNYHIADYNFFYANLRENVADRVSAYFRIRDGHVAE